MRRRALLRTASIATVTALAGCGGALDDQRDAPTDSSERTATRDSPERTGSPGTTESRATTTPEPTTTPDAPVELGEHELVRANEGSSSELVSVVGDVVNRRDDPVESVVVTATFLDAEDGTLDRSQVGLDELSPGETWSFEVAYSGVGEDARAVDDYGLDVEVGV